MYRAPQVTAVATEAQRLLTGLFDAYRREPALLPPEWRSGSDDPVAITRNIGDFIAGMTDRYAIARHRALVGPVDMPEGF